MINSKSIIFFYLQKVGSLKHVVNVASIQWQLSTVQEVHHGIEADVRYADQFHLHAGRLIMQLVWSQTYVTYEKVCAHNSTTRVLSHTPDVLQSAFDVCKAGWLNAS